MTKKDWADMTCEDHFVQFYAEDRDLVDTVADYVTHGLRFGDTCIVAATSEHNEAIKRKIGAIDPEVQLEMAIGQFIALDAHETLAKFMVDGMPSQEKFDEVIGGLIRTARAEKKRIRIFGEMVAVLTDDRKPEAAIALEHYWNDLAKNHPFRLFCAYPDRTRLQPDTAHHSADICAAHSHVIG